MRASLASNQLAEKGKKDKYGKEIPDRIYNQSDYDQELVLERRNELVARKITEFLKATNRFDKTIVFCEDIPHAERMRSLLETLNSDLFSQNSKYVMQITGDNPEGKAELDNFILPEISEGELVDAFLRNELSATDRKSLKRS